MPAISAITREKIKGYLEGFIVRLVEQHRHIEVKTQDQVIGPARRRNQRLKPFHAAIIPEELLRLSAFERSFSSSLGSTHEECARLIAFDHHTEAKRNYDIKNRVSRAAVNEIGRQVEIFEHAAEQGQPRPSLESMVQAVLDARRTDDLQDLRTRADLYIRTHRNEELFFEMKSPVPNKGQCIEVTQRLLRFHLLRGQLRPQTQGYFAMAYNPDGPSREHYKWSMARNYLPFEQAVLIGHEFWDLVGGQSAYEELLEIYQEVGNERSKYMIDTLAFGF